MIRESDIDKLLEDLDLLLISTTNPATIGLIGHMRRRLLDLSAAAAPDEPMTDEEWEPFREAVSSGRYTTDLPDPEPLPSRNPDRRNRSPVTYKQAMTVSCPTCGAKRGEPCIQMRRRGGVPVDPPVETKYAHDARKEKMRNG